MNLVYFINFSGFVILSVNLLLINKQLSFILLFFIIYFV